jgi:hypothetical protein
MKSMMEFMLEMKRDMKKYTDMSHALRLYLEPILLSEGYTLSKLSDSWCFRVMWRDGMSLSVSVPPDAGGMYETMVLIGDELDNDTLARFDTMDDVLEHVRDTRAQYTTQAQPAEEKYDDVPDMAVLKIIEVVPPAPPSGTPAPRFIVSPPGGPSV